MLSASSCPSKSCPVRADALLCPCYSVCQGQPHSVKPSVEPCENPVQLAHLHSGMGQRWRQLKTQQQCLGSRPASTFMTRGYWVVLGSRRPALLSSRSFSASWLSATLSFLMVPTFTLLLVPSLLVMHAWHDVLYLCTHHRLACCDICNVLYLCSGNRLACRKVYC